LTSLLSGRALTISSIAPGEPTEFSAFISYASDDLSEAEEICSSLEARGLRCWMAPRDIRAGREYADEIIRGIQLSRSLVLVLSEAANNSVFVRREVERAVSKRKPIFPIRIEETLPSPSLELFVSATHWIDAWSGNLVDHINVLARELGAESLREPTRNVRAIAPSRQLRPWVLGGAAVALVVTAILVTHEVSRRFERTAPEGKASPVPSAGPIAAASMTPMADATALSPAPATTPLATPAPTEVPAAELPISVSDPEFQRLYKEGEAAIAAASSASLEAQQRFQKLLGEVEKLGLNKVRAERKDTARNISTLFGKAVTQFRLASSKCEEAARHHSDAQVKAFLTKKAKGYRLGADAREMTQQMVAIVMNDPATTVADILPKLQQLAARKDTADKAAVDMDREADAMTKAVPR
jgi:hypothetical protein